MGIPAYHDKFPPEYLLALLVQRKLGVELSPADLRRFVIENWSSVQGWAHLIHKQEGGRS